MSMYKVKWHWMALSVIWLLIIEDGVYNAIKCHVWLGIIVIIYHFVTLLFLYMLCSLAPKILDAVVKLNGANIKYKPALLRSVLYNPGSKLRTIQIAR